MKIRPLHDRVIVKRLEEERKTAGGIVIPDTAPRSPIRAKSSPSAKARSTTTASSSRSTSRSATRSCSASTPARNVKVDGDELLVMREEDIMGVVDDRHLPQQTNQENTTWQLKTSVSAMTPAPRW